MSLPLPVNGPGKSSILDGPWRKQEFSLFTLISFLWTSGTVSQLLSPRVAPSVCSLALTDCPDISSSLNITAFWCKCGVFSSCHSLFQSPKKLWSPTLRVNGCAQQGATSEERHRIPWPLLYTSSHVSGASSLDRAPLNVSKKLSKEVGINSESLFNLGERIK